MKELLAEHTSLAAALLGLAVLTLLVLMFANALRRSARKRAGTPLAKPSAHAAPVQKVKLDPAVLVAALSEAEAAGQRDRLPGLYLSLAHCRLEAGDNAEAEELCASASAVPGQLGTKPPTQKPGLRWAISRKRAAIRPPPASIGRSRGHCSTS